MTQAPAKPRVVSGLGSVGHALGGGAGAPTAPRTSGSAPAPATAKLLPVVKLDPRVYDRALDCVRCGLCLPACPTYTQNGLEADSPRGRIILMKGLADGNIGASPTVRGHLDLCLDCRACETACPSGVVYHELIEETRAHLASTRPSTFAERLAGVLFYRVFPYPRRLKWAVLVPRLLQKIGLWKVLCAMEGVPAPWDKMRRLIPARGSVWERDLNPNYLASNNGKRRLTVGFFSGCVGSVLFQDVNRQAIDLLRHAGCDVVVPGTQACCGAIHHHGGQIDEARRLARANLDAFPLTKAVGTDLQAGVPGPGVDYIVTNIAGCGAMLKEYDVLFRDDQRDAARAAMFAKKVRDISEVLVELRLPRPENPLNLTVTYHDACHLAHAQKVVDQPRQLLAMIPGLKVIPLPESDICCGAAGTYNLTQPAMAADLGARKIENIRKTGATICVTGNAGCALQIQAEADRLGVKLEVLHPVTLLHRAYFGEGQQMRLAAAAKA